MRTTWPGVALIIVVLLAGCSQQPAPAPTRATIGASQITSLKQAHLWLSGLKKGQPNLVTEMNAGITKIENLVGKQDIWFETHNSIEQDLIHLQAEIAADPANAFTKVDDLDVELGKIDAAVAHGNKP